MTASQRLGAWAFGAGSIAFIFTIASYTLIYGRPDASGPGGEITIADSAAHMLGNRALIRAIWIAEMLAVTAHAAGGFLLASRRATRETLAPAGWVLLGIGSTAYLAMYATMLGAYWPASAAVSGTPAVLEAANEQAVAAFLIANVPINLGLALVFAAEARLAGRVVPAWLAWIAALCATFVLAVMLYVLAIAGGMAEVMIAAPLAGLLFVISGVFGIRLALSP